MLPYRAWGKMSGTLFISFLSIIYLALIQTIQPKNSVCCSELLMVQLIPLVSFGTWYDKMFYFNPSIFTIKKLH